jgi:Fe-S oxidoreductase
MLTKTTLRKWFKRNVNRLAREFKTQKSVYLFVDEFTNRNDTAIGIKTIELLFHLGYKVMLTNHQESGRAAISKGLLKYAKNLAEKNTMIFKELIGPETPLVGIEPSAILTFRDEYPKLVQDKLKPIAKTIASNTFLIDEFLADEVKKGSITSKSFKPFPSSIHLHGHCHQKALSDLSCTETILKLVPQVTVKTIPSGCCGMAGSFGYEKEHYQMSMRIGATTLFPYIGVLDIDETIIANGTSCRHQIHDGTQRNAIHAIEFLHAALIN